MDDLKKLDIVNLKMALDSVEKAIKTEMEFLGELTSGHMKDGEFWFIDGIRLMRVKDAIDRKTGKPRYEDRMILRAIKGLDDIKILTTRKNKIIEELIRKQWGDEYFSKNFIAGKKNIFETYKRLWNEILESHFNNEIIISALDEVGYESEEQFIEYMIRMFRRRDLHEWIKYYDLKDISEQVDSLKKANLDYELEQKNINRIINRKYLESEIGKYTKGNLEKFELKYMQNKIDVFKKNKVGNDEKLMALVERHDEAKDTSLGEIIQEYRKTIRELINKRKDRKETYKKLKDEINKIEEEFEMDIDEFPDNLRERLVNKRTEVIKEEKEIENIEKELWGVLGKNKGIIWKHDELVLEYKKQRIKNEKLFKELAEKDTEKKEKILLQKITDELKRNNITIEEGELNELALEVLSKRMANEEEFYEEVLNEEIAETNLDRTIKEVISKRYTEKIKFATPKANRDAKLIELNKIMGQLEELKVLHMNEGEYVKDLDKQLEYYEKERSELSTDLIGDTILKTDIKQRIRKIIEDTKNDTGLSYLNEIEYDKHKNNLIEDGGNRIFNKIAHNEYDKNLSEEELDVFIDEEIWKVLPELDRSFLRLMDVKVENVEKQDKPIVEKQEIIVTKKVDQDDLIDKFKVEFEKRELEKGKTIPNEILYEVAKACGMGVPKIEDFKAGEKTYQIARQYASLLKYKKIKRGDYI